MCGAVGLCIILRRLCEATAAVIIPHQSMSDDLAACHAHCASTKLGVPCLNCQHIAQVMPPTVLDHNCSACPQFQCKGWESDVWHFDSIALGSVAPTADVVELLPHAFGSYFLPGSSFYCGSSSPEAMLPSSAHVVARFLG